MKITVLFHHPENGGRTEEFDGTQAAVEALWAKDNDATAVIFRLPTDGTFMMMHDRNDARRAEKASSARLLPPGAVIELWKEALIATDGTGWRVVFRRETVVVQQQSIQPAH